jgi:hypothetical protein
MTAPKTSSLAFAAFVVALVVAVLNVCTFAQAADPFIGTWNLNVSKSTFTPGPAPKSGSVTFTVAAPGFRAVIEGIGAKYEKTRWEYTGAYDGKDYPLKGNPDGDAISVRRVNANTVETAVKRAGKAVVTNTRTLSADGKTLTVITKGTNVQGQTVHNVQVFEKG